MKRLVALFTTVTLSVSVFANLPSQAATEEGVAWQAPLLPPSSTLINRFADFGQSSTTPLVSEMDPEAPATSSMSFTARNYTAVLPFCDSKNTFACIKSVEVSTDGKNWVTSSAPKEYGAIDILGTNYKPTGGEQRRSSTWEGNPAQNLPPGSNSQVVEFTTAPHKGGSSYLVEVAIKAAMIPANISDAMKAFLPANVKDGLFNSVQFRVIPVKVVPGTCAEANFARGISSSKESWKGYCPVAYNFPDNVQFRMTVELGKYINSFKGWFQGRIGDPFVSQDNQTGTIVISGKPVKVSVAKAVVPGPIPAEVDNFRMPKGFTMFGQNNIPDFISDSTEYEVIAWWKMLEKYMTENAEAETLVWRMSTLENSKLEGYNSPRGYVAPAMNNCLKDARGVTGIMTTNATVYDAAAPVYDKADQSLSYAVAAPHKDSKGVKKSGEYDLVIREDIATCVWGKGFPKATARVEVTNDSGEQQVATTVMNTRSGWVSFSAKNFHYSAPKIKVKLDIPPEPTPTPTPSPTVAVAVATPTPSVTATPATVIPTAKKMTITCVKGKTSNKVTGENPKCPKGFKKK
ncbi:MAG: hypothetical protein ACKO29_04140 [Actinomycetota bacterium]